MYPKETGSFTCCFLAKKALLSIETILFLINLGGPKQELHATVMNGAISLRVAASHVILQNKEHHLNLSNQYNLNLVWPQLESAALHEEKKNSCKH